MIKLTKGLLKALLKSKKKLDRPTQKSIDRQGRKKLRKKVQDHYTRGHQPGLHTTKGGRQYRDKTGAIISKKYNMRTGKLKKGRGGAARYSEDFSARW